MPLVLPDGYGLVTVEWQVAGTAGPAISVWGQVNPGSTAPVVAELWKTDIEAHIMSFLTVSVILQRVTVVMRDGAVYTEGVTTSAAYQGEIAAASASPNTTLLVRKNTSLPGRSNRGRVYLPGVDETNVDSGGFLTPAYQGTIQDELDAFVTGWPGMAILHRNPADPSDYNFAPPTDVDTLSIESKVATQRRRLR